MKKIYLVFLTLMLSQISFGQSTGTKGVDFRMQFVSGKLDFTSISGTKRNFEGIGSELQTNLYLLERNRFRASFMIASRVMTWIGKDVLEGEYDDIQSFSVAPGFELQYGALYLQGSIQRTNANAYNISSTSKGKQFTINGPCLGAGINYKFGSLGMGFGYTKVDTTVSGKDLGLSADSKYSDTSYSFNLIYYIGGTPGKFFNTLFKK
jgi:hypothetical protein